MCNGQLLPISQNTALFSLLGTTYGGDGKSTFALPDLQGTAPMHPGQGPGLSLHDLGERAAARPSRCSRARCRRTPTRCAAPPGPGQLQAPDPTRRSRRPSGGTLYQADRRDAQLGPEALAPAGGDLPHNNMQPYLTLNFCIALQGVFPPRG